MKPNIGIQTYLGIQSYIDNTAIPRNKDKPAKYKILTYDFFNEDRTSKKQTFNSLA